MIADMVIDDHGKPMWATPEDVETALPDGVFQVYWLACSERRASDQQNAKKNWIAHTENCSTESPVRLDVQTSTDSLQRSAKAN